MCNYEFLDIGNAEGNFHKFILNKHLATAYTEFRDYIIGELKQQQMDGAYVELKQTAATP